MPAQMLRANDIQQCYEITGARGPWVTLVHGSGDNHAAWGLQVPALSKRFRVLTYDVRGHGETETPDVPINQETLVEDLRGLLDALKIRRTSIIGYSMGGGIVRNFAATYPERVWGLVMSNGGSRLEPPPDPAREAEMRKMREERIASIRAGGMNAVFDGWLTNVYTPEFITARPEIVEWHRKVTTANDPEKYIRTMGGTMSPSGADIQNISMPTLIIVGAGDEYTGPDAAREFAQALTKTKPEINVFPTRHGAPFERHEEYNRALLSFLEANRSRKF